MKKADRFLCLNQEELGNIRELFNAGLSLHRIVPRRVPFLSSRSHIMFALVKFCACLCFIHIVVGSTLTEPPQSAVVVAFEDVYDLSLLANTLSDEGIDATLIIPEQYQSDLYENLIAVELVLLTVEIDHSAYPENKAIKICEAFLKDEQIAKKISEIQPTFVVFPGLRHDGCLLPWSRVIQSIPVIWTRNRDEEVYVFEYTGAALPVQSTGFWTRLRTSLSRKSIFSVARDEYAVYALRIGGKYLPETGLNLDNLYTDVRLILWGSDVVLRSDFASLTPLIVEVGCHHCRAAYLLPEKLHELVVSFKLGIIPIFLDDGHETMIEEMARTLPQGRDGLAVVYKTKGWQSSNKPENLFIPVTADRQDLIGNARAKVVLSHCADTELLECGFHGTPVICFPRNAHESKNAARAVQLGFARSVEDIRAISGSELTNMVVQMHQIMNYRENARRVSVAIRDRINPAVDRLTHWLRYMARAKDRNLEFLTAISPARTPNEDLEFLLGSFVGCIVGICVTVGCMLAWYLFISKRAQLSKGRYAQ
ncbi:UDP-glucuronosyltransferase 2B31 isoform X3 [Lasioglossum baleicum]|uniref:UDP-glucuronosyltransferase 2B31 isoform X3 n=1 Tax=Lasioglossum baleicum TaxID=434251 RepID=UPI003FCCECF9